jgi:hypothetical protein
MFTSEINKTKALILFLGTLMCSNALFANPGGRTIGLNCPGLSGGATMFVFDIVQKTVEVGKEGSILQSRTLNIDENMISRLRVFLDGGNLKNFENLTLNIKYKSDVSEEQIDSTIKFGRVSTNLNQERIQLITNSVDSDEETLFRSCSRLTRVDNNP